jgi:alginate O-acetyltransferase complex protein AlgJ
MLPTVGMVLGLDGSFVLEENRLLATRPELKLTRASLVEYPRKLEAYFNDRFGFRKRLIQWLAIAKVKGLSVTSWPSVILGKQGWLFLGGDAPLNYYRGTKPFTPRDLEKYQKILEARRDWLAKRGIPYLFVILPNKDSIYPELMPTAYTKVRPSSRCDQLIDHMKAHSTVNLLDVRDDLRRAKDREVLFDLTDTHWNARGAFVAYGRIVASLAAWFPEMHAQPRSEFRDVEIPLPGGDLARMLGLAEQMPERRLGLVPLQPREARQTDEVFPLPTGFAPYQITIATERANAELPRAVMFRDSFCQHLVPFLSEHFERIFYFWDYDFDRSLVLRERPDVVIQEMVERTLMRPLPTDH